MAAPMSDAQHDFLVQNEGLLARSLDCDKLAALFRERNLFREHHMKEFDRLKNDDAQRAKVILAKIRSRGSAAYPLLHEACLRFNQHDLADLLAENLHSDVQLQPGIADQYNFSSASLGSSRSESPVPSPGRFNLPAPASQNSVDINRSYYQRNWPHFYKQFESVVPTNGILDLSETDIPGFGAAIGIPDVVVTGLPADFNNDEHYCNFTKPKGLCYIFNNRRFFGPPGEVLPERLGTDTDAINLRNLFTKFGYQVKIKQDLTGEELMSSMARFALKKQHNECDSAVVVFLTHGIDVHVYGTDGKAVPIADLVKCLDMQHCPGLREKPKLVFVQACRGKEYDSGHGRDSSDGWVRQLFGCFNGTAADANGPQGSSNGATPSSQQHVPHDVPRGSGDQLYYRWTGMTPSDSQLRLLQLAGHSIVADFPDALQVRSKLPSQADILLAYATTPGYVSWRNSVNGSWFVQAVCTVFNRDAHKAHVLDMLTTVNQMVAKKFASSDGGFKQIPCPTTMLTKKFFFYPKHYDKL